MRLAAIIDKCIGGVAAGSAAIHVFDRSIAGACGQLRSIRNGVDGDGQTVGRGRRVPVRFGTCRRDLKRNLTGEVLRWRNGQAAQLIAGQSDAAIRVHGPGREHSSFRHAGYGNGQGFRAIGVCHGGRKVERDRIVFGAGHIIRHKARRVRDRFHGH